MRRLVMRIAAHGDGSDWLLVPRRLTPGLKARQCRLCISGGISLADARTLAAYLASTSHVWSLVSEGQCRIRPNFPELA
jgi:hypothetical protein